MIIFLRVLWNCHQIKCKHNKQMKTCTMILLQIKDNVAIESNLGLSFHKHPSIIDFSLWRLVFLHVAQRKAQKRIGGLEKGCAYKCCLQTRSTSLPTWSSYWFSDWRRLLWLMLLTLRGTFFILLKKRGLFCQSWIILRLSKWPKFLRYSMWLWIFFFYPLKTNYIESLKNVWIRWKFAFFLNTYRALSVLFSSVKKSWHLIFLLLFLLKREKTFLCFTRLEKCRLF